MKNTQEPGAQLKIAKITSRQAVVVAIISAISGCLIALIPFFITKSNSSQTIQKQAWLTVKRIEFFQPFEEQEIPREGLSRGRLVVHVSGISYSYPSKTLYTFLSQDGYYAEESFPLPITLTTFAVSFELLSIPQDPLRSGKFFSTATSTQVDRVKSLPYSGEYELKHVTPDGSRQMYMAARIYYEIREDL